MRRAAASLLALALAVLCVVGAPAAAVAWEEPCGESYGSESYDPCESETGVEERVLEPVCVVPADGTATVVRQERSWSQAAGEERVYGEWVTVDESVVELEACAPAPTPTPTPTLGPPQTPPAEEEVPAPVLAETGPGDVGWLLLAALVVAGVGVGLRVAAARREGARG